MSESRRSIKNLIAAAFGVSLWETAATGMSNPDGGFAGLGAFYSI
jgi:hypothetical protein